MRRFFHFLSFLCCVFALRSSAQLHLKNCVHIGGKSLWADEAGNLYILQQDNSLVKLSEKGDSLAAYKNVSDGPVSMVDVTNPLRILVYHAEYGKLAVLDRMLTPKNVINLRAMNVPQVNVVAASADGYLWYYEQFNARLNKIDLDGKSIVQGNDLRRELPEGPSPSYLLERNRFLYMADTANGVLLFDRFGTYVNTLSLFGVQKMQVQNESIIFLKNDSLHVYDMQRFDTKAFALPSAKRAADAVLTRQNLFLLYADELCIFDLP